jgi:hypothetical protein
VRLINAATCRLATTHHGSHRNRRACPTGMRQMRIAQARLGAEFVVSGTASTSGRHSRCNRQAGKFWGVQGENPARPSRMQATHSCTPAEVSEPDTPAEPCTSAPPSGKACTRSAGITAPLSTHALAAVRRPAAAQVSRHAAQRLRHTSEYPHVKPPFSDPECLVHLHRARH